MIPDGTEDQIINNNDSSKNRRRRRTVARDQLILSFSSVPPDVMALRSIEWKSTGMSRDAWRQCREVAIAIVFCGMRDGCRASVGKLMVVANQNAPAGEPVIGSKATFHRAMGRLTAIGLAITEQQSNKKGNAAALRRIVPERLAELVAESRKVAIENREIPEENDFRETHLRLTCNSPETHSPYYSTLSSSESYSTQPRSTVDRSDDQSYEWEEIGGKANHLTKYLGAPKDDADWALIVKAAALAHRGIISEQEVTSAANGAFMLGKNRWGYFRTCLEESCAKRGLRLWLLLKRIAVPASIEYFPLETVTSTEREDGR